MKFFPSTPWSRMGGMKVWLHWFLTSAFGWVRMASADLRLGRKFTLQEGKSSPVLIYTLCRREGFIAPAGNRITTPWVVQPVAWSQYRPSCPGSRCIRLFNVYHKYTVTTLNSSIFCGKTWRENKADQPFLAKLCGMNADGYLHVEFQNKLRCLCEPVASQLQEQCH